MYKLLMIMLLVLLPVSLTTADALEDAEKIFAYGESNYPELFSAAETETIEILGYIARYYSDTDLYLGTKDGWVYVYGGPFGGLVNVGSMAYFLNLIDGSGGPRIINLTGHWTGTASSQAAPGCTTTLVCDLVQDSDNLLTGTAILSGNCLPAPLVGSITGIVKKDEVLFSVAKNDASQISYTGALSVNGVSLDGDYAWPDDAGAWTLTRD